ncbi:MAG: hypothetical protein R6V37_02135 [Psychroflexus maritimus]
MTYFYPPPKRTDNFSGHLKNNAYSATNAHLMLVNSVTGQTTNFQIDPSQDTTSINISNFPVGYYVIVLVCDGEQVDNKIIQKL